MQKRVFILLAICAFSCSHSPQLTAGRAAAVTRDVTVFASGIAKGITAKGPIAWLSYFDNSPNFFMASDGQLAFHDHASAQKFISDTLVKAITKINLQWNHLRVDPLTDHIATISAGFHEDITMANNKTAPVDGYFTATAILTKKGWQLRNLHWSVQHKEY